MLCFQLVLKVLSIMIDDEVGLIGLAVKGTSTIPTVSTSMTLEMMEEAVALITAMAPPKAPKDLNIIFGQTGLKIIKNEYLANESVVVSEDLFDMIFNASTTQEKTSDGQ